MAFDVVGLAISLASFYGIFALLSLSLNLEYGYGGQPNFGQVMFFGLGAFSAGLVSATLLPFLTGLGVGDICGTSGILTRESIAVSSPALTVSVWVVSLGVAAAIASLLGLLASYPAIRVKEEWFLSMILLVGAEMFRVMVRNTPQFGCGYNGLAGLSNPFSWLANWGGSIGVNVSSGIYAAVIVGLAAIGYVLAQRWGNSPYGRLLKSIRDDRTLSDTLGKDVNRVRAQVMMIGSALAGVAGALYVFYIGVAISEDYISSVTFSIWVMIVVGGIGNNKGALLGALAVIGLQRGTQILGTLLQTASVPVNPNMLVYLEYMVEAGILLAIIAFRPRGLIPERPVETVAYKTFGASRLESRGQGPTKAGDQPPSPRQAPSE